jgi:hypothetical protein
MAPVPRPMITMPISRTAIEDLGAFRTLGRDDTTNRICPIIASMEARKIVFQRPQWVSAKYPPNKGTV